MRNLLQNAGPMLLLTCALPARAEIVQPFDNHGITLDVMLGDSQALEKIGKTDGLARFPARADYHRTLLQLDKSDQWAEACLQDSAVKAQPAQAIAFLCRRLLAGNRLIRGDIAGWAQQMFRLQDDYRNLSASGHIQADGLPWSAKADFRRFFDWPAFGVPNDGQVLADDIPVDDSRGVPVIKATLRDGRDGKKRNILADFIFDTGSDRSHMPRRAAEAMGLEVIDDFSMAMVEGDAIKPVGLTRPVDLVIGRNTFHDVAFIVVDGVDMPLLGLDLLYKMGPTRLGSNTLALRPTATAACPYPLVATSSLDGSTGTFAVKYRLQLDGHPALIRSDTGADVPLEAAGLDVSMAPSAALLTRKAITGGGVREIRHVKKDTMVALDGKQVMLPTELTDRHAEGSPVSWRLGYALRKRFDFQFDLPDGRMCLLPASGQSE